MSGHTGTTSPRGGSKKGETGRVRRSAGWVYRQPGRTPRRCPERVSPCSAHREHHPAFCSRRAAAYLAIVSRCRVSSMSAATRSLLDVVHTFFLRSITATTNTTLTNRRGTTAPVGWSATPDGPSQRRTIGEDVRIDVTQRARWYHTTIAQGAVRDTNPDKWDRECGGVRSILSERSRAQPGIPATRPQ